MNQTLQRIANRSKDLLFNPVLEGYWLGRMRGSVACLLYHRIDDPANNAFLTRGGSPATEPAEFERDLAFLAERGAKFLTFRDLFEGAFPSPDEVGIAICFDDCFLDNYTHGRAVIEKLGVRATFLQATAMVDSDILLWEHQLYWHSRDEDCTARLREIAVEVLPGRGLDGLSALSLVSHLREDVPLADCEQVLAAANEAIGSQSEMRAVARRIYPRSEHLRAVRQAGHEVGSHGHHHYKRANISQAMFEAELRTSVESLVSILGLSPIAFSFPFDSRVEGDTAFCSKHFSIVATCERRPIRGPADFLALPRYSWPGPARNSLRHRRWLTIGSI